MSRILRSLCLFATVIAAADAFAGGDLVHPPEWPCTGCGPRYWGEQHAQGWCPDPCDSCNRWVGRNGAREMPDRLAPWQMAPNAGFEPPEHLGWATHGPCEECHACGPRSHSHRSFWKLLKFW